MSYSETQTQFIEAPNARFAYRRTGTPNDVPLVFVNRFRGTLDWWDPDLIDALAAHREVITFDNIGIGLTEGTVPETTTEMADGVREFAAALGLDQFDVLGWSLGGFVAQQLAARHPNAVRRLIVAGSGPGGRYPGQPDMEPRVAQIMMSEENSADDMLYLFYPDAARAAGERHLGNVWPKVSAPEAKPVTQEAAMRQFAAIGNAVMEPHEEMIARLQKLTLPVLYANGLDDVMIPAAASVFAGEHLANATVVLYSGAGHAFLFQHAAEFAEQITLFLDR